MQNFGRRNLYKLSIGDVVVLRPPYSLARLSPAELGDWEDNNGTVINITYHPQEWRRDDQGEVIQEVANVEILWSNGKLTTLPSDYIPFMTIISGGNNEEDNTRSSDD